MSDPLAAIRPSLIARRERHFDTEAKGFAEVLQAGQREGVFTSDDTAGTAHSPLLATNSLLPFRPSATELGKRKDVEKKVSRIADLLLYGLLLRG